MSWTGVAIAGGTIVGGYIAGQGAKDAGQTGADAAGRAADLQYQQYLQNRNDLAPYRQVATGGGNEYRNLTENMYDVANKWRQQVNSNTDPAVKAGMAQAFGVQDFNDITDEMFVESMMDPAKQNDHPYWNSMRQQYLPDIQTLDRQRSQYDPQDTGSLQQLADYGRSRVNTGDYLPDTQVPVFDVQGNIVRYEDQNAPSYDPNVDVTKDPGYQFRRDEMLRGIDRTSAGMGKLLSGNRLEDIMERTGEMASQEYGKAYDRNLQNYLTDTDAARYGYKAKTAEDALGYGRGVTKYDYDAAREGTMYGRGMNLFGLDYSKEADYLNRLASLSNIGQTATNTGVQAGTNAAANQGNLISQAGQSAAAGQAAQANIYGNVVGDLSSLYAASQYDPYAGMANFYGANPSPSMNANYGGGIPVNNWLARR